MTFAEFKAVVSRKNMTVQYDEPDDKYVVWAVDGICRYEAMLWKSGHVPAGIDETQNAADLAEFEADFKEDCNYAIGQRPYPFATGDFDYAGDAPPVTTCAAGQATPIDYTLAESLYVDGGDIVLEGSVLGDWIKAEIVHPQAGVIKTYIKRRNVPAAPAGLASPIMLLKTPYAGFIPAGLTIRLTYSSTGIVPVKVGVNYCLHRAI